MDMESANNDGFVFRILDWVITGSLTVLTAIGTWLMTLAHTKISEQSRSIAGLRQEHNDFKLVVARDYAK